MLIENGHVLKCDHRPPDRPVGSTQRGPDVAQDEEHHASIPALSIYSYIVPSEGSWVRIDALLR